MVAPVFQLIFFGECVGIDAYSASRPDFQDIGEVITVSLLCDLQAVSVVLEFYGTVHLSNPC